MAALTDEQRKELNEALDIGLADHMETIIDPGTQVARPVEASGMSADSPINKSRVSKKDRFIVNGMNLSPQAALRELNRNEAFKANFAEAKINKNGDIVTKALDDDMWYAFDENEQNPWMSRAPMTEEMLRSGPFGNRDLGDEILKDMVDVSVDIADLAVEGAAYAVGGATGGAAGFLAAGPAGVVPGAALGAAGAATTARAGMLHAKSLLGKSLGFAPETIQEFEQQASLDLLLTAGSYALTPLGGVANKLRQSGMKTAVVKNADDAAGAIMEGTLESASKMENYGAAAKDVMQELWGMTTKVDPDTQNAFMQNKSIRDKYQSIARYNPERAGFEGAKVGAYIPQSKRQEIVARNINNNAAKVAKNLQTGLSEYYEGTIDDIAKVADGLSFDIGNSAQIYDNVGNLFYKQGDEGIELLSKQDIQDIANMPLREFQQKFPNVSDDMRSIMTAVSQSDETYTQFGKFLDAVSQAKKQGSLQGKEGYLEFMRTMKRIGDAHSDFYVKASGTSGGKDGAAKLSKLMSKYEQQFLSTMNIGAQNVAATKSQKGALNPNNILSGRFGNRVEPQRDISAALQEVMDRSKTLTSEYHVAKKRLQVGLKAGEDIGAGRGEAGQKLNLLARKMTAPQSKNPPLNRAMALLSDPEAAGDLLDGAEDVIFRSMMDKLPTMGDKGKTLMQVGKNVRELQEWAAVSQLVPIVQGQQLAYALPMMVSSTIAGSVGAGVLTGSAMVGIASLAAGAGLTAASQSPRFMTRILSRAAKDAPAGSMIKEVASNPTALEGFRNASPSTIKQFAQGLRFMKGYIGALPLTERTNLLRDDVAFTNLLRHVLEPVVQQHVSDMTSGEAPAERGIRPEPISLDLQPAKPAAKASNKPFAGKKKDQTITYKSLKQSNPKLVQQIVDVEVGKGAKLEDAEYHVDGVGIPTGPGGMALRDGDVAAKFYKELGYKMEDVRKVAREIHDASNSEKLDIRRKAQGEGLIPTDEESKDIFAKTVDSIRQDFSKKTRAVSKKLGKSRNFSEGQNRALMDIEYNSGSLLSTRKSGTIAKAIKGDDVGVVLDIVIGMNASRDPGNQGRRLENAILYAGASPNSAKIISDATRVILENNSHVSRLRSIYQNGKPGQQKRMREAWPSLISKITQKNIFKRNRR